MSDVVLCASSLSKDYIQGTTKISVLKHIDLQVLAGERIAIVGASGSGKSTLLSLLGALDTASKGSVELKGMNLQQLNDDDLSRLRNRELGFVYQFHHLLPEFSALENVAMPLLIAGSSKKSAYMVATELLDKVGLNHRHTHQPSALSGGERQRVAIARALVNQPSCVLMDEPTGNLDKTSANSIKNLIIELSGTLNTAFVVVSHDADVAAMMDHIYQLKDGVLVSQVSTAACAAQHSKLP